MVSVDEYTVLAFFQVMAPKQPNTGLFVGLNRGHIVTKKELAPRPSDRKGVSFISVVYILNNSYLIMDCSLHLSHIAALLQALPS